MCAATDRSAGDVYSQHLSELLQREYDRMATLIARGEVIARTVLSVLTVLVAISALALGTSVGVRPHVATWALIGVGVVIGLIALGSASLAQSAPSTIKGTSGATIDEMVGDRWSQTAGGDPLRIVAKRNVEAIKSLRKANETRAERAKWALIFQFAFVGVILIGAATEVAYYFLA